MIAHKYKKADLAHFSASLDGEGSLYCYKGYKGKTIWKLVIMNSNRDFVEKAKKICGYDVGIEVRSNRKTALGTKTIYVLSIAHSAILRPLLKQLIPHLIIKKANAIKALSDLAGVKSYKSKHFKLLKPRIVFPEVPCSQLTLGFASTFMNCANS